MKGASLHRIFFAITTMLLCTGTALSKPAVFADESLEKAKKQALAEGKLLVIDFTAAWCGPCQKMDETTWGDPKVQAWLKDNAIAVQIDVDQEKQTAISFNISAMPTVIVFSSKNMTKEFDRDAGYKTSDQLIEWLQGVKAGKSSIAEMRKNLEALVGKGGQAEVEARYKFAQKETADGNYQEATDQYVWLWNNILKESPAMVGIRGSFMASEMTHLVKAYPAAKVSFSELRAAALKSENRSDWIVLNDILGEEDETLKWFDQVKAKPEQSQFNAKIGFMLQDLLIKNKRWSDMAVYIYKDPIKKLNDTYKLAQGLKSIDPGLDPFPREAAILYTSFLAAHMDDMADKIAREAIKLDNSTKVRASLATMPFRAGILKSDQLKWLDEMSPGNESNFYWDRASVYSTVGDYNKALADYDKAVQSGKPNAALLCARGYVHYMLNQDQAALDDYKAAAALAPKSGWTWVNMSALFYRQKKYQEAYDAANKAVQLDPQLMEAYCNRGEASLRLDNLADAVSDLTRVATGNSKGCIGEALYYRAQAYVKLGKPEQANDDRKVATALDFKPSEGE